MKSKQKYWFLNPFFNYSVGIALVLLNALLFYNAAPLLTPLVTFFAAIMVPLILASLLYYLFRPIVKFFQSFRIPRVWAILSSYALVVFVIISFFLLYAHHFWSEVNAVFIVPVEKIEAVKQKTQDIKEQAMNFFYGLDLSFLSSDEIQSILKQSLQKINAAVTQIFLITISTLTSLAIALVLTPFVLFYFLRDDKLMSAQILAYAPAKYHDEASKILSDIDKTLSRYITGQLMIASILGLFLFIGYLVIGMPFPFMLALFAMVFYTIPFLGTIIAVIPAMILALSVSGWMAIKVIIVMAIAYFLESNIVSPNILGRQLNIHPLTIILLLLAAGSLYGLLGLLLITPAYAILKVVLSNLYKIYRLRTSEETE